MQHFCFTETVKDMAEKAVEQQMFELTMSRFDLEDLIASIVDEIGPEDANIVTTPDYLATCSAISKAERRTKEINKNLTQTMAMVEQYMEILTAEESELEKQVREKEAEFVESCHVIDDDSDDDVKIIEAAFEPRKQNISPPKPDLITPKEKLPPPPPLQQKQQIHLQSPQLGMPPPPLTMGMVTGGSSAASAESDLPSMAHLRAVLADAINRGAAQPSVNHVITENKVKSQPHTQVYLVGSSPESSQTQISSDLPPVSSAVQPSIGTGVAGTQTASTGTSMPVTWKEIVAGSKVLAKKFNDIWYSGVVTDVQKPENTENPSQWKYKVKYDGKGLKVLTGHHIAYREPINCFLKVGTRVTALYRDDETTSVSSFYAGIVAEAPSFKNNKRFLVFFDDGYAQYCQAKELHKVYYQSENVWEDIHPDSQEFIKEYLKQYPERPMVRLMKGQVVKTEWNGRWWTAKVIEVDASLVKMYFQADKRTEWIYRGSTRLEPLFKALANAQAIKAAGSSKGRRLNMNINTPKGQKTPTVEYTRGIGEDDVAKKAAAIAAGKATEKVTTDNKDEVKSDDKSLTVSMPGSKTSAKVPVIEKKRPMAKKSTGGITRTAKIPRPTVAVAEEMNVSHPSGWEAPWLKLNRRQASQQAKAPENTTERFQASSISSNKQGCDMASVLQERLATSIDQGECVDDGEALGERMDTLIETKDMIRKKFVPHTCGPSCVKDSEEDRDKHIGKNPLLVPLLCGWERQICKVRPGGRKYVIYRTPCARRLRNINDLDEYLALTDSQLYIDYFCYDPWLHVHTEFVPVKTFCDIKDLSYGKENVPISCVNGIDRQYPDYVEYSSQRIPSKGVKIELDEGFLQCCDCTDNCRDRSKCACQQLTVENTTWIADKDLNAGYHNRRLKEPVFTGVVECNSKCKCDSRCRNRVAQNGLSCRLQVFKTEKRGWGLRCLNDIPKGGFICIYAGQLLTDTGANDDGKQYGDEYLAELDFIEVVERQKEGYESEVEDPEVEMEDQKGDEDDEDFIGIEGISSSDSDFEGSRNVESEHKIHETRRRKQRENLASLTASDNPEKESKPLEKLVLKRDSVDGQEWISEKKTVSWLDKMDDSPIEIPDDEEDDDDFDDAKSKKSAPMEVDDELPDLVVPTSKSVEKKEEKSEVKKQEISLKPKTDVPEVDSKNKISRRARKSTGASRFKNLPNPKVQGAQVKEEDEAPKMGLRMLFHDDTSCYIMDAKSMGNIGRYLNHSCSPNVFVQNIFVDTHDLRYPWVAFFAGQYIRAGTELTWDYNYEVGSVPDKVLYCYCGSPMCRGRLL